MDAFPALDTALRTVVTVAVSLLVLSERYDFHQETVASPVLLSSAGSAVTMAPKGEPKRVTQATVPSQSAV